MSKFFEFLRNLVYFFKIFSVFLILIILLYWIETLTSANWGWLVVFKPLLNALLNTGAAIYNHTFNLFGAIFETKYIIAIGILVIIYFVLDKSMNFIDIVEDKTDDINRATRKNAEKQLNNNLHSIQVKSQNKINRYYVYIETALKKKFSHAELGYNLDEQNIIMNKFLMEKLNVNPIKYGVGFLYEFDDFGEIDNILAVIYKLIKSSSPLDYVVAIQIVENDKSFALENLKKLISLKTENKIVIMPDTVYRYKFNKAHRYGTAKLGLFQKENDAIELYTFEEIS